MPDDLPRRAGRAGRHLPGQGAEPGDSQRLRSRLPSFPSLPPMAPRSANGEKARRPPASRGPPSAAPTADTADARRRQMQKTSRDGTSWQELEQRPSLSPTRQDPISAYFTSQPHPPISPHSRRHFRL